VKKVGIAVGILIVTFGLGYLIAARMFFPPLPEPKNGIVVPPLSGVIEDEARNRLRPLGLTVSDVYEIAHPDQPPGIVVAQSPLPGQQLRNGGQIRLGVSSGLPRVTVPNVVGYDLARAVTLLRQLGLTAQQRTEVNDRPKGEVLRVDPEPGQRQPVPGRVILVVSAGPPPAPTDSIMPRDTLNSGAKVQPKSPNDTTFPQ
jgi:eukaryotic-like serine/threonine-protein kinase